MALENEEIEVNGLNSNAFDDDIDDLYNEHCDDLIKAKRNVFISKKIIASLETNINVLQKENDLLKKKIESLNISSKVS